MSEVSAMNLLIVRPEMMGFPERLRNMTVSADKIDRGYRLTERKNTHLVVDQKWIDAGHATPVVSAAAFADFFGGYTP